MPPILPASPSAPFHSDSAKWHAVQTRDPTADGVFIYGVRTTHIYCRPNCKARLARRANVVFFSGPDAAEGAGFRACKRCKPQTAGTVPEDVAVARIRAVLESMAERETTGDAMSPVALAAQAGVSRWHFHRTFKQVTGETPMDYLRKRRRRHLVPSGQATSVLDDASMVARAHSTLPGGNVRSTGAAAGRKRDEQDVVFDVHFDDATMRPEPRNGPASGPVFEQGLGDMQKSLDMYAFGAFNWEMDMYSADLDSAWLTWDADVASLLQGDDAALFGSPQPDASVAS